MKFQCLGSFSKLLVLAALTVSASGCYTVSVCDSRKESLALISGQFETISGNFQDQIEIRETGFASYEQVTLSEVESQGKTVKFVTCRVGSRWVREHIASEFDAYFAEYISTDLLGPDFRMDVVALDLGKIQKIGIPVIERKNKNDGIIGKFADNRGVSPERLFAMIFPVDHPENPFKPTFYRRISR